MARWQLSASAVTIARFSDSISSSFGTAVISFDLSPVATCARTNREPAAQALTRCNGDRSAARSKERRSVLPSMAITPWAASAKPSMNCRKQSWNFAGSSRRNTRLKVSWLGIPGRSCRNWRRNGSWARPNLRGERQDEPEDARSYHRRERGRGSFGRTFGLPFQVDPDEVEAKLSDGVLILTLQRPEQDKPKRIRITAGR